MAKTTKKWFSKRNRDRLPWGSDSLNCSLLKHEGITMRVSKAFGPR